MPAGKNNRMKKNDKNRRLTRVAVYLIGMQDDKILLAKRKNVEHMNGYWSLVAGHVYEGESSTQAMIREAHEECELTLTEKDLQLIGAMHQSSPPFDYINFIFFADLSNHNPTNLETQKCEALEFYCIKNLPSPMAHYILDIIEKSTSEKKLWIAEHGWKNQPKKL